MFKLITLVLIVPGPIMNGKAIVPATLPGSPPCKGISAALPVIIMRNAINKNMMPPNKKRRKTKMEEVSKDNVAKPTKDQESDHAGNACAHHDAVKE